MKFTANFTVTMLLLAFFTMPIMAQNSFTKKSELPLDPNVRHGKLKNGMTYYVLHNKEPKERASMYIVQNVGAILENDDQNGLAHFLEHMAFNGTKNYPGKALLDYLEQYGVTFGRNINAFTSRDRTVYMLQNVPTTKSQLVDSALLVIHDWADYLLLDPEEIDKERGVIREEWRTYKSGSERIYKESAKYLYKGSKYANRDVIGDIDIINNFKHKTLKDFYHDWYRTDLQAVIVIGDVDADKIEAKIKKMFSPIKPIKNPKERKYFDVPGNKEPIVGIITDPEETNAQFQLTIKHDATPFEQKDKNYYRKKIMTQLYSNMVGNRISELMKKGTPPFVFGYIAYYNDAPKLNVYKAVASLSTGNIKGGIEAILIENERVKRFGFVESEFERAKQDFLKNKENSYKERNKQKNDRLVWAYVNHFLTNEPAVGIEKDFLLAKELLPGIKLDEINSLAKEFNTEENVVLLLTGPEKEGIEYPNEKELLEIYNTISKKKIEAYKDAVIDKPLVSRIKEISKIKTNNELSEFEADEWTLENGAKVIIKQTDFKDNEIQLRAISKGGTSLYSDEEMPSANFAGTFISTYGLGEFDAIALSKLLSGKVVELRPYISETEEGFRGKSSIDDFETLLQLLYLNFEGKRFDKEGFEAMKSRYVAYAQNLGSNNDYVFNDSIQLTLSSHSPRTVLFNPESLNKVDFETVNKIYKERFADADDFVFVFVGNIDLKTAKPLIEKYIGGIKALERTESWKDNGDSYPKKETKNHFTRKMQDAKTSIFINMNNDIEFNYKNQMILGTITQLLSKKYIDRVREDEGGSYGVRVYNRMEHYPKEEFNIVISFDTDPKKAEMLKGIVYEEIEKLWKGDVDEVDLKEAKEYMLKQREEQLRTNNFWMNTIVHFYRHNENILSVVDYNEAVKDITSKDIAKFAKKHIKNTTNVEVIMNPAE